MSLAAQLLADLVSIPSPNPPGDTRRIANYVAMLLHEWGYDVVELLPDKKPEAHSVVATLGRGSPSLLYHAHIDSGPLGASEAAGWSSDPYTPTIRDGKLYGKGSVDDKGSLAAMLAVAKRLADDPRPKRGQLVMVAAAEEKTGGQLGTRWLADNGHLPPVDFVVVGQPTSNRVATANKGVLRATVRTFGKSVHATNPDRGVNAINAMARIILALEDYHHSLKARAHPLVGVASCNIGVIQGGATANAVADACEVRLDRRLVPREDPAQVQEELIDLVNGVTLPAEATATVGDFLVSNWFETSLDNDLARQFLAVILQVVAGDPGPVGYPPGSDAKHLTQIAQKGMIVFGAGSYEVAQTSVEHVDLAELQATEEILWRFAEATLIH